RSMANGRFERALLVVGVALTVVMACEIAARVAFPWDYYIWSESPFLTNMWKLSRGLPLFGEVKQASSYVYSPGLEYRVYAVLRPLSLHLDLRACRVVNVVVGLGAAYAASRATRSLANDDAPRARLFTFLAFTLLLQKNFTFDVCHPDNLHI